MRPAWTAVALSVLLIGCNKNEQPPPAADDDVPAETQPMPASAGAHEANSVVIMDAAPAVAEPTTPEELELALKSAMVEGRDQDVLAYCEQSGIGEGRVDAQTSLGCTLSACRLEQQDKARSWSQSLPKELKKQAVQICLANKVTL